MQAKIHWQEHHGLPPGHRPKQGLTPHEVEAHLRDLLLDALCQMAADPRRNDRLNQRIRDALANGPHFTPAA